jgi:hypothetical protein
VDWGEELCEIDHTNIRIPKNYNYELPHTVHTVCSVHTTCRKCMTDHDQPLTGPVNGASRPLTEPRLVYTQRPSTRQKAPLWIGLARTCGLQVQRWSFYVRSPRRNSKYYRDCQKDIVLKTLYQGDSRHRPRLAPVNSLFRCRLTHGTRRLPACCSQGTHGCLLLRSSL